MKKALLSLALVFIAYSHVFAYLTQGRYRWRNNDGTEKTATWKAGQDTNITIFDYKAIRLRAEIYNSTTSNKATDRGLVYATSVNGPWYTISNNSAINAFNFAGDNGYITNNDSTTQQLIDPTYAFQPGNIVTNGTPYSDSIYVNTRREYEWCIKPTPLVRPNTTYYFKSTVGSDQSALPSLTTTGNAFTVGPQAILTNGDFENNLTGWTTATANGSSAAFIITNTAMHVHTGSQALVVNVANKGSASNSVTLSATPVALSDTGYYLLRFWALATTQNALLDINLKGATTSNTCHYEIRTRIDTTQNGWVMYQYAFKPTESPVTVQINFNSACTYYLDDVEIINNVTNPNYNVRMQYDWQNNFNETYGWLSGDNNNPAILPDGRVAWVYNDSFMGPINPHTNVIATGVVPHNLLVVQKGDTLNSVYGGSAPNPVSLFDPNNGNEFWQAGAVVENNELKLILIEVANQSSYAGHTWIGSMSLPDLKVGTLTRLTATTTTAPNCALQDSTYDYLYFGASSAANEVHTVVGRVPKGQLDSQTPWQYYTGNGNWSIDFTQALNLIEGVSAGNVIKLGPHSYALSGVPNLSEEVDVWFAQNPWGPWVNKTVIYNIPAEESVLPYEGHIYPIGKNGVYTFSWSLYPFNNDSFNEQLADKTIYVPDYAQANLLAISPFTPKKSADSIVSFTATSRGRQAIFQWKTALTTDIKFIVQQSTDTLIWNNVATVDGNGTNSYQATFNNPFNGRNYFRVELFDEDNVMTTSPVKSLYIKENTALTSFTAKPGSKIVNIAFSTSSELLNDHFTVQNSTDSINWKTLATIQGAGTVTTASNYTAVDNDPVDGFNYYRLQYFSNGVTTYTPGQMVDTRPTMNITSGSASKDGAQVLLQLTSSSEVNNPGFQVQRSADSISWTDLFTHTLDSQTSLIPINYSGHDTSPLAGINYYRVQYYLHGSLAYTTPSKVNMLSPLNAAALVLNVYPNPAKANVSFGLTGYTGKTFTATITDLFGKTMSKQTLQVRTDGKYVLDANVPAGTYILNINGSGISKATRVMVQQ